MFPCIPLSPWMYITVQCVHYIYDHIIEMWHENGTKNPRSMSHMVIYANIPPTTTRCYIQKWWRHQMETFSALLAICARNLVVTVEFPSQRPVTRSFHVFFNMHLNKRLSKQLWGWCFEMSSRPLWRHCNEIRVPCLTWLYVPTSHLLVPGALSKRTSSAFY